MGTSAAPPSPDRVPASAASADTRAELYTRQSPPDAPAPAEEDAQTPETHTHTHTQTRVSTRNILNNVDIVKLSFNLVKVS